MKMTRPLLITVFSLSLLAARADDAVKLEPNATLKFEFPDLPETYYSHFNPTKKRPAMLTAQLPENYSPSGKYPLFIFLNGGGGGVGDNAYFGRRIVGSRDFICVSMPLFKNPNAVIPENSILNKIPAGKNGRSYQILYEDYPVIGPSYRTMLQKLLDTVPNIVSERSAMGGFSNGANTTAALVANKDEFILKHIQSFIFLEGGTALFTNPLPADDPEVKKHRFLILSGDQPDAVTPARNQTQPIMIERVQKWKAGKVDVTLVIMPGYGHAAPPEYQKLIGAWVRGEVLPKIESKAPVKSADPSEGLDLR